MGPSTPPPLTILVLSPIGTPPYSIRGAKQSLKAIEAARSGMQRRTVNGNLIDLTPAQFHKYATSITCDDFDSPAFDGVFPGFTITVDCISELSFLTSGGSPQRPVVPGSQRTDGGFTFYRPRLSMMVLDTNIDTDEWGHAVSWSIQAEEI